MVLNEVFFGFTLRRIFQNADFLRPVFSCILAHLTHCLIIISKNDDRVHF